MPKAIALSPFFNLLEDIRGRDHFARSGPGQAVQQGFPESLFLLGFFTIDAVEGSVSSKVILLRVNADHARYVLIECD